MGKLTLIETAVLLLLCSSFLGLVWADCDITSEITELNPCLSVGSGSDTAPSQACCATIKSLAADLPCLCELIAYAKTSTIPAAVNLTSLLNTVPAICHVEVSADSCSVAASSPDGSPASSPRPFILPFPFPLGPVPAPLSGLMPTSGASRKIPGTILSILQYAAAPALLSLVLRA